MERTRRLGMQECMRKLFGGSEGGVDGARLGHWELLREELNGVTDVGAACSCGVAGVAAVMIEGRAETPTINTPGCPASTLVWFSCRITLEPGGASGVIL